jgi:hypothetical protein
MKKLNNKRLLIQKLLIKLIKILMLRILKIKLKNKKPRNPLKKHIKFKAKKHMMTNKNILDIFPDLSL